ncbi:DUF433 domain-containing protein [Chamaesiphon sp. OTE_75_metabat_556]|uniref:DUF433 domain-containing protein n=1 Tax=Chamaesiphon sp. OTE_75_metabat_556 TaxID=2964692 RepID=UPI00286B20DF|nr:DUF433 domain-containing protein [Chamaesiphon sp. OTE_75_metabat_556]
MDAQELQTQLLALPISEKTEILQVLIQNLTNSGTGIIKKPGVVGGDACIAGTRIPVWDLVEYRRMGASDLKILEAYPQLTATDLYHAWVYADAFPDEINAAIEANEAAYMIASYADEQFPLPVVTRLRAKSYDVLTVLDAGNANQANRLK